MQLEDIIKQKINEGLSAIEINKYLRENNMPVNFILIKKIINNLVR